MNLNLGCGQKKQDGWHNVDKYPSDAVDECVDLEVLPWPWPDNSADKVQMVHVLEHLGQQTSVYLGIIKELYRVCKSNAEILIIVPDPRHDDFLGDPTHVRPITPSGLSLFSQKANREWIENGAANTPLAIHLGVDFEIVKVNAMLDQRFRAEFNEETAPLYNNLIKQWEIMLKVIK